MTGTLPANHATAEENPPYPPFEKGEILRNLILGCYGMRDGSCCTPYALATCDLRSLVAMPHGLCDFLFDQGVFNDLIHGKIVNLEVMF